MSCTTGSSSSRSGSGDPSGTHRLWAKAVRRRRRRFRILARVHIVVSFQRVCTEDVRGVCCFGHDVVSSSFMRPAMRRAKALILSQEIGGVGCGFSAGPLGLRGRSRVGGANRWRSAGRRRLSCMVLGQPLRRAYRVTPHGLGHDSHRVFPRKRLAGFRHGGGRPAAQMLCQWTRWCRPCEWNPPHTRSIRRACWTRARSTHPLKRRRSGARKTCAVFRFCVEHNARFLAAAGTRGPLGPGTVVCWEMRGVMRKFGVSAMVMARAP